MRNLIKRRLVMKITQKNMRFCFWSDVMVFTPISETAKNKDQNVGLSSLVKRCRLNVLLTDITNTHPGHYMTLYSELEAHARAFTLIFITCRSKKILSVFLRHPADD